MRTRPALPSVTLDAAMKTPRSVYESMTRGELIDALCAADAQPSASNTRMLDGLEEERAALEKQLRLLREQSERAENAHTRFVDLFEHAPVAYLVMDRNATIKSANAAAAALLCSSADELVGSQLIRLVPITERQALLDHVARCMDERLRVANEVQMRVRARGDLVVQLSSTPRSGSAGWVEDVRTVLQDVTRTRRSAELAQFLARVDDVFADAVDASGAASAIARACVPLLGDAAFVDLCDDGVFARRAHTALTVEHEGKRGTFDEHAVDPAWRRYVEHVVRTKTPVFEPESAAAFGANVAAKGFILVPLDAREKVIGVLGALRIDGRGYSLEELELAQNVARRAARAIADAAVLARFRASRASPPPPR